jgi:hypothetical protein
MIEDNAEPNKFDRYMTQSEIKEYVKSKNDEYKENYLNEHKDEIERRKIENKGRQKEFRQKWNEEHKDEIEDRKRKQREYAREMRKKYKKDKRH